jgi:hypothetical protein
MQFDSKMFDGLVILGHVRAHGIWAAQMQILGSPVTRYGGLAPSATRDTLLTAALIASLKSITAKKVADLMERRQVGRKPALLIGSIAPEFCAAIEPGGNISSLGITKSLRDELVTQLTRFRIDTRIPDVEHLPQSVEATCNWVRRILSVEPNAPVTVFQPLDSFRMGQECSTDWCKRPFLMVDFKSLVMSCTLPE